MKITDIFVNRPVLATVITLLILLIGFRSMTLLELREYPRADKAVISVTTAYPGADADQGAPELEQPQKLHRIILLEPASG